MGCFSYICKCCNESVKEGEGVKLWLLQNGKVLEEKEGNYNSYGAVDDSPEWKNDWGTIVELKFNHSNDDGIAAIHSECWDKSDKTTPISQSEDDEDQGCGTPNKRTVENATSKFYGFIDEKPLRERDEHLEKLNEGLSKLLKEGEALLKHLKDKENK